MKKKVFIISLLVLTVINLSIGYVNAEEVNNTITKITLAGNKEIANSTILARIQSKVGEVVDRDLLKQDLKAIYDMGYFQDVQASFKSYRDGLEVIFEVVENPLIKEIEITGSEGVEKDTVLTLLGVETGKTLDVNKLNEGLKNVQHKFQDEGYILARYDDVNVDENGILKIKINVGYLNEVIIQGNEKTKDFVILRELGLEKGQAINRKKIQTGYQNLYKLSYFKDVQANLERVDEKANIVNLVVNVEEDKTGSLNFGGGWSSSDGWFGKFNIQERNLDGNGQTLGFDVQFGETTHYSLNFFEPWLMGSETSLGFSIYNKKSESTDQLKGEYSEERQGGTLSLGHPLSSTWDGSVRFKMENSLTDWVDESYTYTDEAGVEQTEALTDQEGSIRSLTFKADRDTTNHFFNPTEGGIDTISVEYAGQLLSGDYNFTKYNLDLRRYYPGFKRGHAWALRLNTGFGEGEIPLLEKYRLGGSETLRGYENNTFSGDNMVLMQLEYRLPIADNFTGVIFADGGNTWDEMDEMKLDDLNYDLGLGLRMNTPLGQIRFDYGFDEEWNGTPQISIGHTF